MENDPLAIFKYRHYKNIKESGRENNHPYTAGQESVGYREFIFKQENPAVFTRYSDRFKMMLAWVF